MPIRPTSVVGVVADFSLKSGISQKWPDNFFSFFFGMELLSSADTNVLYKYGFC